MELQNAYKKCQIYKKEAQMFRKKLENVADESRMDDFERRINSYARENLELKEEIKQLKKIGKLQ
jgi:predicted RNase H-like nuclease (RuvC/YqgF family)